MLLLSFLSLSTSPNFKFMNLFTAQQHAANVCFPIYQSSRGVNFLSLGAFDLPRVRCLFASLSDQTEVVRTRSLDKKRQLELVTRYWKIYEARRDPSEPATCGLKYASVPYQRVTFTRAESAQSSLTTCRPKQHTVASQEHLVSIPHYSPLSFPFNHIFGSSWISSWGKAHSEFMLLTHAASHYPKSSFNVSEAHPKFVTLYIKKNAVKLKRQNFFWGSLSHFGERLLWRSASKCGLKES